MGTGAEFARARTAGLVESRAPRWPVRGAWRGEIGILLRGLLSCTTSRCLTRHRSYCKTVLDSVTLAYGQLHNGFEIDDRVNSRPTLPVSPARFVSLHLSPH